MKNLLLVLPCLLWMLSISAIASTIQLPQTGQTTTFASSDDGDLRAGISWPSPRFVDNGDGTIRDSLTGLIWSRDPNPTVNLRQGYAPSPQPADTANWQNALDHLKQLNAESYLGFNDWRLPSLFELLTLFNQGAGSTAQWLTMQGFTAVKEGPYWSSTSSAMSPEKAWTLELGRGAVTPIEKDKNAFTWPVRSGTSAGVIQVPKTGQTTCYDTTGTGIPCAGSGQDGEHQTGAPWPMPRFSNNGNGIFTDNLTGLDWASYTGIISGTLPIGATGASGWEGAFDLVSRLNGENYLGYNDWRVPNRVELASVANYTEADPATWFGQLGIPVPETIRHYWSSGTAASNTDNAWVVGSTGAIDDLNKNEVLSGSHTWAVRGGETGTSAPSGADTLVNGSSAESAMAAAATLTITTSSLPAGTVGTAYSQTLAATGGTTPYTWSRTSGTIPAGLSLNSTTGEISGTPTAATNSSITFKVTDSTAKTASKTLTITINTVPPTITTTTLPDGELSVGYSYTLTATGGKTPYTWSRTSGMLPAGLTLSSAGVIGGTPTTEGSSAFTVQVKDGNNAIATKNFTLTIAPPFQIVLPQLSDGYLDTQYSQNVSVVGGKAPYLWSIISGTLPPGLVLNESTGEISGTPTSLGSKSLTIQVTDANNATTTMQYSINIKEALNILPLLHDYYLGVSDNQALQAIGGVPPYSWSIVEGSLPAGLLLSGTTNLIYGTPTSTGSSNFTVQVTDAANNSARRTFAVNVTSYGTISGTVTDRQAGMPLSGASVSLYLTFTSNALANRNYTCNGTGLSTMDYNTTLKNDGFKFGCSSSGAVNSMQYKVRNPYATVDPFTVMWNGISSLANRVEFLAQGFRPTKSGALNKAGFYVPYGRQYLTGSLTAQVKATLGGDRNTHLAKSNEVSISFLPVSDASWVEFTFPTPVTVSAGELYYVEIQSSGIWDSGILGSLELGCGASYSGGNAYEKKSGGWNRLPMTLAFRSYVDSELDVAIEPSGWLYEMSGGAKQMVSLYALDRLTGGLPTVGDVVNTGPDVIYTRGGFQYNGDDLTVKWTALEGLDHYYDQTGWLQFKVDNYSTAWSTPPVTSLVTDEFSVAFTHRFTATTDANGAYSFPSLPDGNYILIFDQSGLSSQVHKGDLSPGQNLTVNPAMSDTSVRILTESLSIGSINTPYSQTLTATGGTAPYTFATIIGTLPKGLTLNSSTGAISGTPSQTGDYTFTIQVTDAGNNMSARTFTVRIFSTPIPQPLTVSPLALSFDTVYLGSASTGELSVTNSGSANIAISQVYFSAGKGLAVIDDNCSGKTHAAGATCTMTVRFSPTRAGIFSDFLNIPTDDPYYPSIPVALNGTALLAYMVPHSGGSEPVRNPMRLIQSGAASIHDDNTLLYWQQQGSSGKMTWGEADSYCSSLNLDGRSGWRLPSFFELATIVHYGTTNPAIDTTKFSGIAPDHYWTSTTGTGLVNGYPDPNATTVDFQFGETGTLSQSSTAYALCTNGEALTSSIVVEGTAPLNTFTDLNTGLVWMGAGGLATSGNICPSGTCHAITWEDLPALCGSTSYGGYGDWRAPTIKELATLPGGTSWSMTPSLKPDGQGSMTGALLFSSGTISSAAKSTIGSYSVRCVRGGNLQQAKAAVTPTYLDFGTFDLGSNPTRTITVGNTGGGALTIGTITTPAAPFAVTVDSCSGQSVAGGASCTVTVQLAPGIIGNYSGTLTIPTSDTTVTVPLTGTATTPAPVIGNLTIGSIGPDSGVVTWTTDQQTTGAAQFGTTTGYGYSAATATLTAQHSITLNGLTPGTVYHLKAISTNATGVEAASGDYSFVTQTLAQPGHLPAGNYLSLQEAYNRAAHNDSILALNRTYAEDLNINRPITATLKGGYDTAAYTSRTGATVLNGSLTIADGTLIADNLTITGSDPNSNLSISNVTATGTTITWNTSLLADSRVDFGETTAYGSTIADKALNTAHSMVLTGLKPGTTYHFRVTSVTPTGISATSDDYAMATPAFVAATIAESGNVTVMEVSGDFNAKNGDGSSNDMPRAEVAKEYLRHHSDSYDFLVFLTTFDYAMLDPLATGFYTGIKNDIQGINDLIFDSSSLFGSNGKLQGTIDLGNITALSSAPHGPLLNRTVSTLNHEIGHRFGMHVRFKKADGSLDTALIGRDGSHWSYLLDSKGSLMYGNGWQENSDGNYTSTAVRDIYSPLDLYLMGMIPKEQVPPMVLIDNQSTDKNQLPQPGASITGTTRSITIDDIIAAEGPRIPDAAASQKEFKVGFILLTRPGTAIGNAPAAIETLRTAWAGKFAELTRGIGKATGISPSLTVQVDSPADGATITGPDVTVTGTVINTTGAETGVMVNGVPATITGSSFVANHVPLQEGANTIEVKTTDANGLTNTVTRNVTAQAGHYLRITSNIDSGTGPLNITLKIDSSFIAPPTVGTAGPVVVTLTQGASDSEFNAKLTVEGTYSFTASATGPDGQSYMDTVSVTVLSKSQLETLLQGKWNGMKAKVVAGDIQGAGSYFPTATREAFQTIFSNPALEAISRLNEVNSVEVYSVSDDMAQGGATRQEAEGELAYPINFTKDENGLWRIHGF